ncbi:MAG: EAL domain-containing protein [Rhodanobacteraceae bacterium]
MPARPVETLTKLSEARASAASAASSETLIHEVNSLRQSVARLQQAERLQRALYSIAAQAAGDQEMSDVLRSLHATVAGLMYAENLFIVLHDPRAGTVRFIYFVDVADPYIPDPEGEIPLDDLHDSLIWHVLRGGEPLMGPPQEIERRVGHQLKRFGPECVDWLGVPLVSGSEVVGGIVVQSYNEAARFSEDDRTLLTYVAQHIHTALERRQARTLLERRIAERTDALSAANADLQQQVHERQRGERLQAALFRIAELANASGGILEFYGALHRVIGSLLYAQNFYIALLSNDGSELTFPYSEDEFDQYRAPRRVGNGLTEYVLRKGEALLADRAVIQKLEVEQEVFSHGTRSTCWLGIPLTFDQRAVGVLAVQSYSEEHRYTLRDQALLTFVSYHIANALERKRNAETLKQAYAELEQRVGERTAELARANEELRAEISRREFIEQQLTHETLHDALTGLPNRALLLERLTDALSHFRQDAGRLFAVLFLDLDRFKIVNDSIGHLVGDELLKVVGRRLAGCLKPRDVIARLGGDEFAVLLTDIGQATDATACASRLIAALNMPVRLDGKEIFTSASIGIALVSERYQEAGDLLRDADAAMYRAKADGRRRYAIFDGRLRDRAVDLLELEGDLRRAIDRDEFEPYFQPLVELDGNRTVGYEALVRWRHPHRGLLEPDQFLAVAEEGGLGDQIDWRVFENVADAMTELTRDGEFVSINLSGRHFHSASLAKRLLDLLATRHIEPTRLRIEVTEHVLLDDAAQIKAIFEQLRNAGITVALDDFGTGYSSLSYLHQFPLQALKIDGSFIAGLALPGNTSSGAVVRAILALAGALGMQTIAEGIETEAQRAQLLRFGCRYGQGFLFGHPSPAGHWIARRAADVA